MRSIAVIVVALALSACSILDQIEFGGSSLDPSKIYLTPQTPITVSSRDTYRYACVGKTMICVQRGISFECRCP